MGKEDDPKGGPKAGSKGGSTVRSTALGSWGKPILAAISGRGNYSSENPKSARSCISSLASGFAVQASYRHTVIV
jgi:hypothetical protein